MGMFRKAGERDGVTRHVHESNGLEVLLREEHSAPVVSFLVLYRVGSRNEAVGHTGATHLLEHMMFKGTPEMNRDRGTQIAAVLERVGADFNATTWYDRTNYFETVPSDQLELAVRIEADRMRNSFIADSDRQSEMSVVRNELERGENEPLMVLDTHAHAVAFREHPYHHPTIGWQADVEGVPTSRLKAFYDTFYWPDNATVIVVGDFDTSRTLGMIDRYFGAFSRAPEPIPGVYTTEPEQQGERRFTVHRTAADGIVLLSFRTPEAAHGDSPALAVVRALLGSGRSSRLYRALVDTQLASEAAAGAESLRDPGLFQVYAVTMPEVGHETVERVLIDELSRLRNERVSESELRKAKRLVRTQIVFGREGSSNFGYEMSESVSSVDWSWFFDFPEAVERVTTEDVQRVARAYFRRSKLTSGWFVPHRLDDGEDLTGTALVQESAGMQKPVPAPSSDPRTAVPPVGGMRTVTPARIARAGSSSGVRFADRVNRQVLGTGTALVLERSADATVAIRAQLLAGSWFSPGKHLLSDVTARMLRRGTTRRGALQFAEDLESLGAALSISSGAFTVDIRAHALAEDAAEVLDAIAEMLREPAFAESELEKVKSEIAAEIRQEQDSTSARALERLLQLTLPPAHPYYQPPADDLLAELKALSTDDLRECWRSQYSGNNLMTCVVGDVAALDALGRIDAAFGHWQGPSRGEIAVERALPGSGIRASVKLADKANADVAIGLPGTLRRKDPDYFAAAIGNAILGQSTLSSRLGIRVRDREGLTYGISSSFYGVGLVEGLWLTSVTVQPANVERAIASTLDEIGRAVGDGVTDTEVEAYRSNFIGTFKVGLATNAGIASRLMESELYGLGPEYLDTYGSYVDGVTLSDVNGALQRHIDPDRLTIVVAGDV